MRRVLLLGLAAAASLAAMAPARAEASHAAAFTERIAGERSAQGLSAVVTAPDLEAVARRHAERMAARGEPYHNPDLGNEVDGWEILGENVGTGPSVDDIHAAFMASKTHRGQILYPTYTEVGVGVVDAGDTLWVVEVFRKPTAQSASATSSGPATVADVSPPAPARPAATAPAATEVAGVVLEQAPVRRAGIVVDVRGTDRQTAWAPVAVIEPVRAVAEAAEQVPAPVAVAAGLLAAVVGAQAITVRRLGLA